MANLMQASFTAGELAPVLHGRVDLQKYQTGAALLKNWIPMQYGGVTNRPGMEYVTYAKSRTAKSRLIPFQAENGDAFVIELADGKIRFIRNGGVIVKPFGAIDDVTHTNPLTINAGAAHGLSTGDLIAISDVVGMSELNGQLFRVFVDSIYVFRIANPVTYQVIDGSDYGAYVSGGVISKVYEVTSPWAEADLPDIDYAQSVDLVVLVHPDYPPQELKRLADDNWTLTAFPMSKGPFRELNTDDSKWMVTHGTSGGAAGTIGFAWGSAGDVGKSFYVAASDRKGAWQPGVAFGAGSAGDYEISNGFNHYLNLNDSKTSGTKAPTHDNGTQWDGYENASIQWQFIHPGWGIGVITAVNAAPNTYDITATTTLPTDAFAYRWALQEFDDDRGYPRAVCFYQQRLFFGGNTANPEAVWASRIGNYYDFIRTDKVNADDPMRFASATRKLNRVRYLDGIGSLICLTSSSENIISGQDGIISPASLSIRPQSYLGCAGVKPLLIGSRMLFVQSKGRIIRDMAFSLEADAYIGDDLTLLASHLFEGKTVVAMAYAQHPHSLVWVVLDDGSLLSLTYYREQEVLAWAQHETDGLVEDVVVVSEDGEDAVYLIVNRDGFDNSIFGTNRRFIERLRSREMLTIDDAFFVDCGLEYDGNNTGATYVFLATGGGWTIDDTITVQASDLNVFTPSIVGDSFFFRVGDDEIELVITAVNASDELECTPTEEVPVSMRLVNSADWGIGLKTIRNLHHLSSREVTALADGNVLEAVTVDTNGTVTLSQAATRIVIGLPYESVLQTLPLNVMGGETTQAKRKIVNHVSLICDKTRGLSAGPDEQHLTEFVPPLRDRYTSPVPTRSGLWDTVIRTDWKQQAQVVVVQADPLPATILSIIPEVSLGG